jgi:putative endopeptidase
MDSDRLNRDGYQPVLGELKKLSEVKTTNALIQILPELMLSGTDVYFSVYVDADPMNSSVYLTQTYQSGISLGEREYYLDQDAHSKEILEKYKQHVAKMFELFGFNSAEAQKNRDAVLSIETRLAKASYDRVKLRDPYANYHKMSLQDLGKEYPAISWKEFLTALGIPAVDSVNVSQKEFLSEVANILTSVPLNQQIAYLQWKVIDNAATYLSDDIYNQNFEFTEKLYQGKRNLPHVGSVRCVVLTIFWVKPLVKCT